MNSIENKIQAIIFDLDGTIVTTEEIWKMANLRFLENRGITDITQYQDLIDSFSGQSVTKCSEKIKARLDLPDSIESLVQEYERYTTNFFRSSSNQIQFIDGFESFYSRLKDSTISTAIGTNSYGDYLSKIKVDMGLDKHFGEHIYSISHVGGKAKPNPDVFLHAADKLKVHPKNCVVFEDSLPGFMAASDAGMKCIAVKSRDNINHLSLTHGAIENYHQAIDELKKI